MSNRKKASGASSADSLVIGRNAVLEVLRHRSDRVKRLLCTASESSGVLAQIMELAERAGVAIEQIDRQQLENLAGSSSHQGVALALKQREFASIKKTVAALQKRERSLVLALDGVQDPQNVGAILRAAECFGVDAVLWSKNRGPRITPTITKVSVGASELLNLVPVSNLAQGLKSFRDAGYWTVAALISDDARSIGAFEWPEKAVVIVGAEGSGVRERTAKESDFQVYIPMVGQLDSLNVSQASTLLMYAWSQSALP